MVTVSSGSLDELITRGTYVYPQLLPIIFYWISPEFCFYASKIVNNFIYIQYPQLINVLKNSLNSEPSLKGKIQLTKKLLNLKTPNFTVTKKPKRGFFYLISDCEYTKIGYSYDVKKRLDELQTGNPKKLSIIYTYYSFNPKNIESKFLEKYENKKLSASGIS